MAAELLIKKVFPRYAWALNLAIGLKTLFSRIADSFDFSEL